MTLWTKKKYHHVNDTIEVYDKDAILSIWMNHLDL